MKQFLHNIIFFDIDSAAGLLAAIRGGHSMKIDFSPPDITQSEIDAVVDALKSGWKIKQ